jgi:hypothetical protein
VATIQQKIQELEDQKSKLDEKINALKTAQEIMGKSGPERRSQSKKASKVRGLKAKGRKSRKSSRSQRRDAGAKESDKKQIVEAVGSGASNGKPISQIAKTVGRKSDATLRNDIRELLDEKKIKKQGERAKTVYFK